MMQCTPGKGGTVHSAICLWVRKPMFCTPDHFCIASAPSKPDCQCTAKCIFSEQCRLMHTLVGLFQAFHLLQARWRRQRSCPSLCRLPLLAGER